VIARAPVAADREAALEALDRCGAFTAEEVRVAIEMFDDGLNGDYSLLGVDVDGVLRGYVCVGKAWLTQGSWYLYWICVHPAFHGRGVAQLLQRTAEDFVRASGGERLVLEPAAVRRTSVHAAFTHVPVSRCKDEFPTSTSAATTASSTSRHWEDPGETGDPQPRQRPLRLHVRPWLRGRVLPQRAPAGPPRRSETDRSANGSRPAAAAAAGA
jgi:GNAT superfamily N-acetyltransferase